MSFQLEANMLMRKGVYTGYSKLDENKIYGGTFAKLF